ncbi:MAG: endopeptidase La [Candidatus Latescibacteria bacterium]|nr:endopeptidase La [Candidatus Latescibacterota bacterium]
MDNILQKIPSEIPILPLRNTVVFPSMAAPLMVSREKSVKLVDDVLSGNKLLGTITQRSPDVEEPTWKDIYNYGTVAIVHRMIRMPDGSMRILIQGIARFKVKKPLTGKPYLKAEIELLEDIIEKSIEIDALARNVSNQFQRIISLVPNLPDELGVAVANIDDPGRLADLVASDLNISTSEKQEILETVEVKKRLEKLTVLLARELQVVELETRIQKEAKSELEKTQREYFLRQQLQAIQKELGEGDPRAVEINELRSKIEAAKMPKEAKKEAEKELSRLEKMMTGSPEYTVVRTYLDWLTSLPWSVSTKDNLDIAKARQVLEEDHYNLEKVKERILEYLAVRKLKEDMKGPILCFVGPPGVGKTSLGKSIARALGRKFVRISLGGVRDEAEIRGHRRTYVGALPGRIIQGIRKAGSNNPVFMMDEIDKVGADFRGDPSAALLEVLDPEQNYSFSDHYLDVSFDLSRVMFITTANVLDTIPSALRDRMEVLELPGYTEEEKLQIAKRYLIPRQLEAHGIAGERIKFEDEVLKKIIRNYTREAGLRNFEREIANICRKIARNVAEGKKTPRKITLKRIEKLLGPIKFTSEVAERTSEPGVATGVAWTPAGGEILFIESTKMKGKKGLILTGQLGDVMKESAQTALSYIRANAGRLKIPENFFDHFDIHIHVPAGAIPKDGPSAGVTLTTSLVSLLTGTPVSPDIAMTGEITLRGRVLPVGGIKEKVLAANRAGIKRMILPQKNKKDMEEIPQEVKEKMKFIFVENIGQVLEVALKDGKKN